MGFRKWVARAPALEGLRHAARWVLGRGFMHAAHMFGARKNRVLFSSFRGKGYSDSPRAISEALRALCPNAEIVWQFREGAGEGAPAYVRRVRYRSLGALCKIATARVLVDNFNRPHFMPKYADQVYVQTWHGDRAFKKVLFDAFPNEPFPDGAQMDLAVAGSDYGERQFRSAFRYAGDVLKAGLPRNDVLVHPPDGLRERVRRSLGILDGEGMLLYAPTFRDATRGAPQPCPFSMERALEALAGATGMPWRCYARGHELNRGVDTPCARDVSKYPEMSELLLAADMLITDYSSCAGDFALTGRPIILYQADRAAYVLGDRGLYFDIDESPYWVARTQDELHALFDNIGAAQENCAEILKFYGASETGRAAEAVAKYIAARLAEEKTCKKW